MDQLRVPRVGVSRLEMNSLTSRGKRRQSRSASHPLGLRRRLALKLQREVGRALAPLWVPAVVVIMRHGLGYRIRDIVAARRTYRELVADGAPLMICANHLTMVDSALIAWGLGSPPFFLRHHATLPWNVPEGTRVSASLLIRVLAYVMKCVPIERGSDRGKVALVLSSLEHLLRQGEVVLMFPEGGRSRTGRLMTDSVAQGVGRLIGAVPHCRVLCVYLRGEDQHSWSTLPARRQSFYLSAEVLVPHSEKRGMRRSRDLAMQVLDRLAVMEERYLAGRQ